MFPQHSVVAVEIVVVALDRENQILAVALRPTEVVAEHDGRDVADDLRSLSGEGLSLNAIARRLNEQDVRTARGGTWTATAVRRALDRLAG
jgi:hypothetical protein